MPKEYQSYIEEWKVFHPDWKIMRWDETNSPMDLPYLQTAKQHAKWANMSNLVRFYALIKYGGIYLDTDVKIIKPLDSFLKNQCFLGFEEGSESEEIFWVNNAVIGAQKKHLFIHQCYEAIIRDFDGLEEANLSAPQLVTKILKESFGLKKYGAQTINGVTLYPISYFYPIHYSDTYKLNDLYDNIDETTFSVHMWGRSWLTQAQLLKMFDDLQHEYKNIKIKVQDCIASADHIKKAIDEITISEIGSQDLNLNTDPYESIINNVGALKHKFAGIKKQYADEIVKINEVNEVLQKEVNHLKTDITAKSEQINQLNEKYVNEIKEIQKENTILTTGITDKLNKINELNETCRLNYEKYADDIKEANNEIKRIQQENNALKTDIIDKYQQIIRLNEQYHVKEIEQLKEIEALKQLNALLNQTAEFNQTKAEANNNKIEEYKSLLETSEKESKSAIHSLQQSELFLKDIIKTTQLQLEEKEKLIKDSSDKIKKAQTALAEKDSLLLNQITAINLLNEKNSSLTLDIDFTKNMLNDVSSKKQELEMRMSEAEKKYDEYYQVQEKNNTELLALLKNKLENCKTSIKWYQSTYEKRNILGIIKDRMLKKN